MAGHCEKRICETGKKQSMVENNHLIMTHMCEITAASTHVVTRRCSSIRIKEQCFRIPIAVAAERDDATVKKERMRWAGLVVRWRRMGMKRGAIEKGSGTIEKRTCADLIEIPTRKEMS